MIKNERSILILSFITSLIAERAILDNSVSKDKLSEMLTFQQNGLIKYIHSTLGIPLKQIEEEIDDCMKSILENGFPGK